MFVNYIVPATGAGHGEKAQPEFSAKAIIETTLPDGNSSLSYLRFGLWHYVGSCAEGTGSGQWSPIVTAAAAAAPPAG